MKNLDIFDRVRGGLIVSCQALENEPLHSSFIMSRMAVAAEMSGAVGIRANTVADITEIRKMVRLPMIGIIKQIYKDSDVYITPTMVEVDALVETGVEIIAMDATNRLRTGGKSLDDIFHEVRNKYPDQLFMADCSCYEERCTPRRSLRLRGHNNGGLYALYARHQLPDLAFIQKISQAVDVPVIAEGGIHYPQQLRQALDAGAFCAVVGGAITRPQEITKRFVEVL